MKKTILILSTILISISLTVFGYIKWGNSYSSIDTNLCGDPSFDKQQANENTIEPAKVDFSYAIGTRFGPITREEIRNINTFTDFLSSDHTLNIVSWKSLSIVVLDDDRPTAKMANGTSGELNKSQLNFLLTADYSTNILIRADFINKNSETGELEEEYSTPHMTIVPAKQAIYNNGNDALIAYIQANCQSEILIAREESLDSGKLYFHVTSEGQIENARVESSCGYKSIDQVMVDLINSLPGQWEPAVNSAGDKVGQTLVLSFGTIGC